VRRPPFEHTQAGRPRTSWPLAAVESVDVTHTRFWVGTDEPRELEAAIERALTAATPRRQG